MEQNFVVPPSVDLIAVATGALQGAVFASREAKERHIDVVGVILIGISTGIGGGIIRDLLLNQVPAALKTNSYLITVVIAALVGMMFGRLVRYILPIVVAIDAASLGLYLVVGLLKAQSVELGTVPTVFVGIVAATAGGMIRDIIMGADISLIQVGSLYTVAALAGAIVYLVLDMYQSRFTAGVVAVAVTFALRLGSLKFGWSTPRPRELNLAWLNLARGGRRDPNADRSKEPGR